MDEIGLQRSLRVSSSAVDISGTSSETYNCYPSSCPADRREPFRVGSHIYYIDPLKQQEQLRKECEQPKLNDPPLSLPIPGGLGAGVIVTDLQHAKIFSTLKGLTEEQTGWKKVVYELLHTPQKWWKAMTEGVPKSDVLQWNGVEEKDVEDLKAWKLISEAEGTLFWQKPVQEAVFQTWKRLKESAVSSFATEQRHPKTKGLSATLRHSLGDGLKMLLEAEKDALKGFDAFSAQQLPEMYANVHQRLSCGGSQHYFGAGSSGRVGYTLKGLWHKYWAAEESGAAEMNKIQAHMGGGGSAFIRAQEGVEDSVDAGRTAVKEAKITKNDVVTVISASGSAKYCQGVVREAADAGALVYYFHNNKKVPQSTQALFEEKLATPICVEVGPQSIAGSTRMSAASSALLNLGLLQEALAVHQKTGEDLDLAVLAQEMKQRYLNGFQQIFHQLSRLETMTTLMYQTVDDPDGNLRQLRDQNSRGYVTALCGEHSFPLTMTDYSELAPTFGFPHIQARNAITKTSPFRAYLVGQETNEDAWKSVLSGDVPEKDHYAIGGEVPFGKAFERRPQEDGNLFLALMLGSDVSGWVKALKTQEEEENCCDADLMFFQEDDFPPEETLASSKDRDPLLDGMDIIAQGLASRGLIVVTDQKFDVPIDSFDGSIVIDELDGGALGIVHALVIKNILNTLSTATATLCGCVEDNLMINLNPSNDKLKQRAAELMMTLWNERYPDFTLDYSAALKHVIAAHTTKEWIDQEYSVFTPSAISIALVALANGCSYVEAITRLAENKYDLNASLPKSFGNL